MQQLQIGSAMAAQFCHVGLSRWIFNKRIQVMGCAGHHLQYRDCYHDRHIGCRCILAAVDVDVRYFCSSFFAAHHYLHRCWLNYGNYIAFGTIVPIIICGLTAVIIIEASFMQTAKPPINTTNNLQRTKAW
jgi:hypothetical protein